jgi:hypothetical protein
LVPIVACWFIHLENILADLRYLETVREIGSDWSVSILSSLNIQLANILTQIGKLTVVNYVWTDWGIQSNWVINHVHILTWILYIVAVANVLVDFYIFSIWGVNESNILTYIFHILWVINILAYTSIWLWIVTIEIDKLTHTWYLWASIKYLINGSVCICWNINITNILIQTRLWWRVRKALVVSCVLQNVNVVYIDYLQRAARRALALTSKYLRDTCNVNYAHILCEILKPWILDLTLVEDGSVCKIA